jgi:hypothetical protein
MGLRPLAYWDCGFESRLGHGCLSVVSVVCCQVEVSATGWSLVQRSPTECMCVWVWSWSVEQWGSLGPQGAVDEPLKKKELVPLSGSFPSRPLILPYEPPSVSKYVYNTRSLTEPIVLALTRRWYHYCAIHMADGGTDSAFALGAHQPSSTRFYWLTLANNVFRWNVAFCFTHRQCLRRTVLTFCPSSLYMRLVQGAGSSIAASSTAAMSHRNVWLCQCNILLFLWSLTVTDADNFEFCAV